MHRQQGNALVYCWAVWNKPPKVVFKGEDGREAFRLCTEEPDEVPGAIVGERVGGTERGRESRGRHTYRPSESEILLVSTFHHKKERKLYFLLPDELRELFAPLLDKAIKEEKKREKLEKANNTKPPIIEEPEYIDDDELTEYDFFDDDEEEDEDDGAFDIPDNFFSFLDDIRGKIRQYSEEHGLNSPTYKYSCSVDLMEAIRQLPYEKKVEIVKAFYRLIKPYTS